MPYVQLMARLSGDDWHVFLRTCPIPIFLPEWRDTQVFSARVIHEGMGEAIGVAFNATGTWGAHPLQLSLSFAPHPGQSRTI